MNSPFNQNPNAGSMSAPIPVPMAADASTEARLSFIRLTYVLFLASIVTTVVGGIISLNSPIGGLVRSLSPWSFIAVIPLSIGAQMLAREPGKGNLALFGFAGLLGMISGPAIASYSSQTVTQAGVLSLLVFGTLTAYAFITRKDFNFLGGIAFVGVVTVIGAGLLNFFFFKNSGFSYWLAWALLLFSSCFVLYKTSAIMRDYPLNRPESAALGLMISFFNIFISLLRILNGRN